MSGQSVKKQNNGRAYKNKSEDKEHHFDYCFEFDTNTKARFLVVKNIYFCDFLFHCLEVQQIKKL